MDRKKHPRELEDASVELVEEARREAFDAEQQAAAVRQELARTKGALHALEGKEIAPLVGKLSNAWRSSEPQPERTPRMVDDPVYRHIVLDAATATVVSHPLVQRLNYIKQLSFSYLQFPSSTHSRLAHSLGAAKNAELAMQGIFDRGKCYTSRGEEDLAPGILAARTAHTKKAKITALLHDLGHGPFGHALDKYIGFRNAADPRPSPDKHYTVKYLEAYLRATLEHEMVTLDPKEIAAILRPEHRDKLQGLDSLIADVVDSPLDVDRMDYLIRDAHMTGLSMGFTNIMALLDRMCPYRQGGKYLLTYDYSAVPYIEHFLYARDAMFINCYEHPRKLAAERVFTRIVDSLLSDESLGISEEDLVGLTDEQIMVLLSGIGSGSDVRTKLVNLLIHNAEFRQVHEVSLSPLVEERTVRIARDELLAMSPAQLGDWIASLRSASLASGGLSKDVRDWNEAALRGRDGNLKETYILKPKTWEELIAGKSIGDQRAWQILVVVPSYEVYLAELSATRILVEEPSGGFRIRQFFEVSSIMREVLENLMVQRRKIRVFCPADVPPAEETAIKKAAIQVLGQ
jgi:HD superfamily phosphohydrolase